MTEDYLHDLGDEQELLLSSALYYQANNTCPEVSVNLGLQTKSLSGVGVSKNALSKSVVPEYFGPKLNVRSPLQDAIINDVYFDKFSNLKVDTNNDK